MLFGLDGLGRRLFLHQGRGLLTSGVRLQLRLRLGLGIQREQLYGGLLLEGGTARGRGLVWGVYKSRTQDLRSPCTRSFSIIGVLWL